MKFIKRITRITTGRIEAFLSSVDDPETLLPQLIKEMRREVRAAGAAEAKALAALKSSQRKLDELIGRSIRLERGAELALRQGDENTAKEALVEQVKVDKQLKIAEKILKTSESAYEQARQAHLQIQYELKTLTRRGNDIIARAKTSKNRSATISPGHGNNILDEITKIEHKLDGEEAVADVLREQNGKNTMPLELRLREIERKNEIEERLRQLKTKSL